MKCPARLAVLSLALALVTSSGAAVSRANTPPRKVVVASAVANLSGSLDARLQSATQLFDEAVRASGARPVDLFVLPEFAFCVETGTTAAERSVTLATPQVAAMAAQARAHHAYVVAPMTLREGDRISNAAVLFDRAGQVAGIFRKVHPVADAHGVLEDGVTAGADFPVFDCDFGKLGLMICWDMAYEESWDTLAARGAEIVAVPSASPQTLRPAAHALRHSYYVLTSTPREDATLFDPIGRTLAQQTHAPGVVVHEIDLAYAILHWSENLHEGRALTDKFGSKVGGTYSVVEDTGVFWSNDPKTSIGDMVRSLGLPEMPAEIERIGAAAKAKR